MGNENAAGAEAGGTSGEGVGIAGASIAAATGSMGAGSRTGLAGAAAVTISSCTDFTVLAGVCAGGKLSLAAVGALTGEFAAGCSLTGAVAI